MVMEDLLCVPLELVPECLIVGKPQDEVSRILATQVRGDHIWEWHDASFRLEARANRMARSLLFGAARVNLDGLRGRDELPGGGGRHDVPFSLVEADRLLENLRRLAGAAQEPQCFCQVDESVSLHVDAIRLERELDRLARELFRP